MTREEKIQFVIDQIEDSEKLLMIIKNLCQNAINNLNDDDLNRIYEMLNNVQT